MTDLTEKSLEDLLVALNKKACEYSINLRPATMHLRPELVQDVADKLNITFDQALAHIKSICIGAIDVS